MTIERESGLIRFTCESDGCRANYESEADTFAEAWREARASGWVTSFDGEYHHHCHACARDLGDD